MERHFETSLRDLKGQLLAMAGQVEKAIESAIEALQTGNIEKITLVDAIENKINQAHIAVDDACIKLLALQQPLAADLRLIVAILKINTDLERMGDQAVNIAHHAEQYIKGTPVKPLVDLPLMFQEARFMVREALDAFVKSSEPLARDVLKRDDIVDGLKDKISKDVLEHVKTNPILIEQGLILILIARNLERIGDHATNIAEDVIYAMSGEDIRHSSQLATMKKAIS